MLEIGIGDSSSPAPRASEPSLSLDDDGYYWFLYPLFTELAMQTGQPVDPYENAYFEGANLALLAQTLEKAKALIESQPETWSVSLGVQHHRGNQQEVFHKLDKARFQELISQWQKILVRAREMNLGIVCFGD